MSKVGRNDPCPCGSGKKYKKCHGKLNLIEFPGSRTTEELDQFFLQFQTYMRENYPHMFPSSQPVSEEEEVQSFISLLYKGLAAPQKGGATVYQRFLRRVERKVTRPSVEEALRDWEGARPSIFKMTGVEPENDIFVTDLLNDKNYKVDRKRIPLKDEDLHSAPYYTGILLQWGDFYRFSPMAVPIETSKYKIYHNKLMKGFEDQTIYKSLPDYFHYTFLEKHLPLWIYSERELVRESRTENKSRIETEVIELLDQRIDSKVTETDAYQNIKRLWRQFFRNEQPAVRKVEVMAAALEYYFYHTNSSSESLSQKEISHKYGISPNSLSKWNAKLEAFSNEKNHYVTN
ncbi:YecA family protein [Halobacillus massiliensis]|uniref:YecA family protein n=1 Tax=Halobacillus massiliensis TaxID=1926286 RepID=UPI0009E3DF8B|nr:SEC-C metal-binding domain-containing protein [Halobacillus massiliensis]